MQMKFSILLIFIFSAACCCIVSAQSVGINNATPHASAILDVKSNSKGMLIPRTSTTSRLAIINPAKGLMVYDTTTNSFWFYNSSTWTQLSAASNSWGLAGNTFANPATTFIGSINNQPLRFRVNNLWAGEIHPTSANVFLGVGAGQADTDGRDNTAIGEHSLFTNSTGSDNSATGAYALSANTTGSDNTANGSLALFYNTSGSDNTANGDRALYSNTTGNRNTANGGQALELNNTGNENTATGFRALFSNTTGTANTATGVDALLTNNTGNFNTANGHQALYLNTIGTSNTAIGYKSLYSNTEGNDNIANGYQALYSNTTGFENTAIGAGALYYNTTGSYNTANGYQTLYNNTAGNSNTATGRASLYINTSGINNTANGDHALFANASGSNNTASGNEALSFNSTGSSNAADGARALYKNTSGTFNTANGNAALFSNTTGWYNTAIGDGALFNNIDGDKNIAIGANSGTHANAGSIFNTISIGNDDYLNAFQNQVFIGNTSTGYIGGKVTWSTFSDARIKNTIVEDVKGLDFILRLRPVTYHISNKAIITVTGNKETPDFPGKYDGEKVKYTGFIAQEVEQAAKAANYDFSGYAVPKNQWGLYSISYEQFVVPLVKAVQEQQKVIIAQQTSIEQLKKQMDEMKATIDLLMKKN